MAQLHSRLPWLGLSLALHAGLIGLAAGVVYSVAQSRPAIRVTILPGGGGGAGGVGAAPEGAVAAPMAPPAPVPAPRPAVKAVARPRKAAAAKPLPRVEAAAVAGPGNGAPGGEGSGSGPGSGSGSGGGEGSGVGTGEGAGRGSGREMDLRLYCVSCPEPPYPRMARVRGWQGATDVELLVLADGRVDDATVTRSSGFDVLDRAALDVARQSRFSPPPQSLEPPVRGRLAYRFELRRSGD